MQYNIGDSVKLRKQHPCGGKIWTVIRVGADIKIKCNTCGRVVMLDSQELASQVVELSKAADENKNQCKN